MGIRYFKAVTKAQTRLWFGPVGPLLVAVGIFSAVQQGPPALSVALFLAGSSIMRIQASMVERNPWKSLRNGAILILGFMVFFAFVLGDYVWTALGAVIGVALLWLHREHEQFLASLDPAAPGDLSYADQLRRAQAAQRNLGQPD